MAHSASSLRGHDGFELHALDDHHSIANLDLVAGRHGYRHHDTRHRGTDDAAVIRNEEMGATVDLDVMMRSCGRGHDAVFVPVDRHSALELAHAAQVDVGVPVAEAYAVSEGSGARHIEHVSTAAMAELDPSRHVAGRLRASASAPGIEVDMGGHQLDVVAVDCRHQQGEHRVGPPRRLIARRVGRWG